MAENTKIEEMYTTFLKEAGLDESLMSEEEKKERKFTFVAGLSMMFFFMRDDIADIEDEDAAVEEMEKMNNLLINYWENEEA